MSAHTPPDSTEPEPPTTEELADLLGTDTALLDRFAEEHPDPTAPIVIGWAHGRGELRCHPEQLRPDVEAWLDARPVRPEPEPQHITEVIDDGRNLRTFGVSTDE